MAESEFRKGKITICFFVPRVHLFARVDFYRHYLNTLKLGLHSQSLMLVGSVGCRYVI